MAPPIGNYVIFADSPVTMRQPSGDLDNEFTFALPENLTPRNPVILSFKVTIRNARDMVLRIHLNGASILNRSESGNFRGFVQEVVGSGGNTLLKPSPQTNTLVFSMSGIGRVTFSDMVITYQRNTQWSYDTHRVAALMASESPANCRSRAIDPM